MHAPSEQHTPPWRTWHLITGAAFLTAGVFLYLAFDYSPNLSESLAVTGFFGILILPVTLLLLVAALYAVARLLGRTRDLILPCLLLAILLAAYGWFTNRPIERFRKLVLDPPPQSLSQLHVDCRTSFNDGRAWLFTFHLNPTDFPTLISNLNLQPHTPPLDDAISPAKRIQRDFQIDVSTPATNEFFVAPKTILVTDPTHTLIRIYLDRWRAPSPP